MDVFDFHARNESRLDSALRVTKHKLALLINFNVAFLKDGAKRVINSG
jgi:hypothetical protein